MPTTDYAEPTVLHGLDLPIVRTRVTLRLLEATTLPDYKGNMLRGGFGYAFQRVSCLQSCWGHSEGCAAGALCTYRWIFETPHPPDVVQLHDLQDVPRPFVIEPPLDHKREYAAGDTLEFDLVLIGRAIEQLPVFLLSFEQLGRMGLGRSLAPARLERVEALRPWQPTGSAVYLHGRDSATAAQLRPGSYAYDAAAIAARAAQLPADMQLTLRTPLRVKSHGDFIRTLDLPAIVQSIGWRLHALATFHGGGPWSRDYRNLAEQARAITIDNARVQWVDWERTSTRSAQPRKMTLGGIVGSATLRDVTPDIRALLLAASLVHVGKAAVFGHGELGLR